ncbi:MAG TPA: DUF6600 domain-containing protein, partial [Pyrinomonadaceae bacterium]|nr:DUF6600 domain-containing protein [Pyrinomonadaceae bacterium]
MRSRHSLPSALLFLLSTFLVFTTAARADEDTYEAEYEETARVARVSLTKGEASLRRAGEIEWERARINVPLVEGDTLATGRDSRMEIQIDARNFVRVGELSVVKVVTLRDEGVALSVTEGTATLRLARFDPDREYFEIDAPKTTIAAEKTGLYRLDVSGDGGVRVTVRDDGRARIYSETSGFVLRNNRSARLVRDGAEEGDWELSAAAELDEWDFWIDERERHLASLLRLEGRERYYDQEVWGAEELDAYGDWEYTRDYGYIWRPRVTVVNNYYDWAPYRYGHWRWCSPYGWTWIPDEDWGWAPYHYGRWVYYNSRWCWAPRGYGYHYGRARWRPALVVFVNLNFGRDRYVSWYPLTHGQRDPRGRWWRHDRDGRHHSRRLPGTAFARAVTRIRESEFGSASARPRRAEGDIAQRTFASEPVRGRLPITPADTGAARAARPGISDPKVARNNTQSGAGRREGLFINRPDSVNPPRSVPDRTTGAALRAPGVALDKELRRTRVFGNREPRSVPKAAAVGNSGGSSAIGDSGTGAVERPKRISSRPSLEGPGGSSEGAAPSSPSVRQRPAPSPDGRGGAPDGDAAPRVRRAPRGYDGDANNASPAPRMSPARPPDAQPGGDST